MTSLAIVTVRTDEPVAGHMIAERLADRVDMVDCDSLSTLGGAILQTSAPWLCIVTPSVRLYEDGLERTLAALDEPALETTADALIHPSTYLLLEGQPPSTREVYRLVLGEHALAATPTTVLGLGMVQPGALVVKTSWLASHLGEIRSLYQPREIHELLVAIVRYVGGANKLLLLQWQLSERHAIVSPEVLDLEHGLQLDFRYQKAMGDLWKYAWHETPNVPVDQVRLVHALGEFHLSAARPHVVRRIVRRLLRKR
ncbi:MAG: hypothetical protein FJW98_00075 [Actinobacteria bacterium]|nr:hypothetical protein [Actinomycetota bacterium]